MGKLILMLVLGLLTGAIAGFLGGSSYAQNVAEEAFNGQKEEMTKEVTACKDAKEKLEGELKKLEAQYKTAEGEVKLNENREGFVSGSTLPAPEFVPANLEPLETDAKGDVTVNWRPVKGAKKYIVKVENNSGKVVHSAEVQGDTSVVVNIVIKSSRAAKAEYFVRIASVNGLDQEGPLGPKKPVHFSAQAKKSGRHSGKKHRR